MKANDMADDVDAFINAIENPTRKADAKNAIGDIPTRDGAACEVLVAFNYCCLLYTSPSPRDGLLSRMPSSA